MPLRAPRPAVPSFDITNADGSGGGAMSASTLKHDGCGRLARYPVVRRLRKTLYGETLLCRDTNATDPTVRIVLKRISLRELSENTVGGQENPMEERHVIHVVQRAGGHTHIVHYASHAMFVHNDSVFIAMEFCEDGDLFDHLERQPEGFMCEREALSLVHQVAQGVAFLHSHGIAHRDLSLENVLLHRGVAKLCDFGLSCDATRLQNETVGKVGYMAPEVASGDCYDAKAVDVWALGVLLFVLLTGSPLVADNSTRTKMLCVIQTHGVKKVLQLWRMLDRMSSGTLVLLDVLLQVDPSRRPPIDKVLHHSAFWTLSTIRR